MWRTVDLLQLKKATCKHLDRAFSSMTGRRRLFCRRGLLFRRRQIRERSKRFFFFGGSSAGAGGASRFQAPRRRRMALARRARGPRSPPIRAPSPCLRYRGSSPALVARLEHITFARAVEGARGGEVDELHFLVLVPCCRFSMLAAAAANWLRDARHAPDVGLYVFRARVRRGV